MSQYIVLPTKSGLNKVNILGEIYQVGDVIELSDAIGESFPDVVALAGAEVADGDTDLDPVAYTNETTTVTLSDEPIDPGQEVQPVEEVVFKDDEDIDPLGEVIEDDQ